MMLMGIFTKKTRKTKSKRRKAADRRSGTSTGHIPPVFGPHGGGSGNGTPQFAHTKENEKSYTLPRIAPWKIILGSFIIGICGVFYISHVFQTQQLLKQVNSLEQQYEKVKRTHDQLELKYERMTGPRQIYDKAKEYGFVSGGPVEKVLIIKE